MRPLLPLLLLLLPARAGEEETKPDPRVLKPGHAPTPFTADEIREGCPAGRVTTFRIQRRGAPAVLQTMRFTTNDVAGTVLEMRTHPEGKPPPRRGQTAHATWQSLQAHASFPAEQTKIGEAWVKTALGSFRCLVYEVRGGETWNRFCFAHALPGPPVFVHKTVKGKDVMKMGIVAHRDGTEPILLTLLGLDGDGSAKDAFARLDKDESGAVSPREFPKAELTRTQRARAFQRIDRDANTEIDAKELARAAKDWRPKKKGPAKK